jgi:hypothetical protein
MFSVRERPLIGRRWILAGAVDGYLKSSADFPHPGIGQPAESIDEY